MSLRYDVNISLLFNELPLLQRPAAAKAQGFDVIESWWPFAEPVPDSREVDAFVTAISDAGVRLEALNFYGGDMPAGDRGVLSIPSRTSEFRDSVDILASIAAQTGCSLFNALYGVRVDGVSPERQDEVAVENLSFAAEAVAPIGGSVLLEPLASGENGAYPLTGPDQILAVIDRVRDASGAGNVRLLADFYHLTRNGFDWRKIVDEYLPYVGHVQIADAPGRHQPGTGEIDYAALFAALEENAYEGCVGLEYRPEGSTEESLSWLPRESRGENGAFA
ncbi:TIM barrel protein [Rugosimonospora acidiphila]|uniref:TIM barrel protein n=1 Tax=Rugosimonospora acidiphila TaxID=556531 RepID=A0ABP9SIR9_9ACTN